MSSYFHNARLNGNKGGRKGFSLQSFWISCKKQCLEGDGWQDTTYPRDILSAKTFLSSYVPCNDPRGKQKMAGFCIGYISYEGIIHFVFIYILRHIKCCSSSLYGFVFKIWCRSLCYHWKKWNDCENLMRRLITCNLWRPNSVIMSLKGEFSI